jgi:hypothetical protein
LKSHFSHFSRKRLPKLPCELSFPSTQSALFNRVSGWGLVVLLHSGFWRIFNVRSDFFTARESRASKLKRGGNAFPCHLPSVDSIYAAFSVQVHKFTRQPCPRDAGFFHVLSSIRDSQARGLLSADRFKRHGIEQCCLLSAKTADPHQNKAACAGQCKPEKGSNSRRDLEMVLPNG